VSACTSSLRTAALAGINQLTPEHLAQETLLTFPVPQERLDILTEFLMPSYHMPKELKKIESLEIILQMTALQRGVCVLPEWLADNKMNKLALKKSVSAKTAYIGNYI
nr:hypothetical protein [Nitrosomonas sp.]